jgi:hypothetical protein
VLSVARRIRIVTVAVFISDPAIGTMDHYFGAFPNCNLSGSFNRFALCIVSAGNSLVTFSSGFGRCRNCGKPRLIWLSRAASGEAALWRRRLLTFQWQSVPKYRSDACAGGDPTRIGCQVRCGCATVGPRGLPARGDAPLAWYVAIQMSQPTGGPPAEGGDAFDSQTIIADLPAWSRQQGTHTVVVKGAL